MKILFVNKFLFENGGSETYCFKLAEYLKQKGHSVQFFGMDHDKNVVGNDLNLYVKNVEFKDITMSKILYPFKIIYSTEARNKIRELIEHYKPDIVHLNNYNFQITPSILYEIKKHNIPVVMTLHDFQIVCPNHMMYIEHEKKICEECKSRKYINCIKNKCIHNSKIKSLFAAFEGYIYYKLKTYEKMIDYYIAPSNFLKDKICEFGEKENRIKVIHNFVSSESKLNKKSIKKDYVLYFGRLSIQKGIRTLISACNMLPEIEFVVAGRGELEKELERIKNVKYIGFRVGEELNTLISEALFSIYPSEWYENCPMSVLESQMLGTPVIGANIGGIPELIDNNSDGLLFEPGNVSDLVNKISFMYSNRNVLQRFSEKCTSKANMFSVEDYYNKLFEVFNLAIEQHTHNMK